MRKRRKVLDIIKASLALLHNEGLVLDKKVIFFVSKPAKYGNIRSYYMISNEGIVFLGDMPSWAGVKGKYSRLIEIIRSANNSEEIINIGSSLKALNYIKNIFYVKKGWKSDKVNRETKKLLR